MRIVAAWVLAAMAAVLAGVAAANDPFPDKRVQLIVPFPPGGVIDLTARPVAAALERLWKQPVIVVNRPGGGGGVGAVAMATSKPDGYSLLLAHMSMITIPASDRVFGRAPSFALDQFTPLGLLVADPLVIIAKSDGPYKTLQEMIEAARKAPGAVAYGSSGNYSAVHVPMEMIALNAGVKFNHVAYQGGGPALTAVMGGHVVATMVSPAAAIPQVKRGDLRALAVTGSRRIPTMPDTPTVIESGIPDVDFYLWVGVFAPAQLPGNIETSIRDGLTKALKDPELIAQMAKLNLPIEHMDAPAFKAFLAKEEQRLGAVIQRIGKVD
ncbi:MAG: tripartite tricarboxylate transporter substrate binding protein [Burkholderiales bacterium]